MTQTAESHGSGEQERTEEALLLDYLKDRDAACPVCSYNVRCLTVARCPECGRGLRLSVGATEPYLTPWIVLVIATFAATGIAMLLDIYFTYMVLVRNRGVPFHAWYELLGWFSFNVSVLPAIFAVIFRRRMLRWATGRQWFWAVFFVMLLVVQIFMGTSNNSFSPASHFYSR